MEQIKEETEIYIQELKKFIIEVEQRAKSLEKFRAIAHSRPELNELKGINRVREDIVLELLNKQVEFLRKLLKEEKSK